MHYQKRTLSPHEEAENEALRAAVASQQEELDKTKLLLQYVADMTDVYIPEESEETEEEITNEQNV